MSPNIFALYSGVALIWGSTWIAITLQLGVVDPMISVIYRFGLAALLMLLWCGWRRINLKLTLSQHLWVGLQGTLLFGLNYWVLYVASQYVTSGLIAAVFTCIVFFNALISRVFLSSPSRPRVIAGGVLGLLGVGLLFHGELTQVSLTESSLLGLGLALLATLLASFGNVVAAKNVSSNQSITAVNAWAMVYGTVTMVMVAGVLGVPYNFDFRPTYALSLLYLAFFGSVLTFAGYLRLIETLGPDKAAYMSMLVPVIALVFSSLFEGFTWSLVAGIGLICILLGNWVGLRR